MYSIKQVLMVVVEHQTAQIWGFLAILVFVQ